jgi:hypothetical protein
MGIVEVDPSDIALGESGPGKGGSAATGGAGSGGSKPSGAMLVGKPCETSSDCPGGQTCHMDDDFISHKQCTLSCDAGETCEAVEKTSFCIGAKVCVHACDSDADCGPKTRCGTAGWCERSGPGSGVPYCGGIATPCGLLSGSECGLAAGCRDDSECLGSATSCYSLPTSYACSSQDGCHWSSSSQSCSGLASSCFGSSFEFQCTSQAGCYWSPSCTGNARACDEALTVLCTNQPGCTIVQD